MFKLKTIPKDCRIDYIKFKVWRFIFKIIHSGVKIFLKTQNFICDKEDILVNKIANNLDKNQTSFVSSPMQAANVGDVIKFNTKQEN